MEKPLLSNLGFNPELVISILLSVHRLSVYTYTCNLCKQYIYIVCLCKII